MLINSKLSILFFRRKIDNKASKGIRAKRQQLEQSACAVAEKLKDEMIDK